MKSGVGFLPVIALAAVSFTCAVNATTVPPQQQKQELAGPWLPFDPGEARCSSAAGDLSLSNAGLRLQLAAQGASLKPVELKNQFTQNTQALRGELFEVTLGGGRTDRKTIAASQFQLDGPVSCKPIAALPLAARAAERRAGVALVARFKDPQSGLAVDWQATLREGTNYVREQFSFESRAVLDLAAVKLISLQLEQASVVGDTAGSPLASADNFFGFEHPMSQAQVLDGRASAWLARALPLRKGVAAQYSAVIGVAPAGQLRRGFQAYLENERATPFRTFLHYNSWYDIGFFTPYTQEEAVGVINAYADKLVRQRGVMMDSFLFDDGWDDQAKLWQFSKFFPQGFTPVREAAEKIGAEPGVWLSPWGGYGEPRERRLNTAKAGGYELDAQGLALSGKKYYGLFHERTVSLLKTYGINQFKLDGTGSPDKVTAGSDFDSDFAAAMALIEDLRAIKPDLFINLTTGTWPSPFWLRTADSIWRSAEDHAFAGVGSNRQRWITYRDSSTYGGIVRRGPLFPLNSLMLHGMIYSRKAEGLNTDPFHDFADEVLSYFATGTGLQEMYISPDLLNEGDWNTLAASAKWARANALTLRDSHWIGGDPARLEVYGWASWSPGRAIVTLRNPSDKPQQYLIDIERALELPRGEPTDWMATPALLGSASGSGAPSPLLLRAGVPQQVQLKPFQVLVWELSPAAVPGAAPAVH